MESRSFLENEFDILLGRYIKFYKEVEKYLLDDVRLMNLGTYLLKTYGEEYFYPEGDPLICQNVFNKIYHILKSDKRLKLEFNKQLPVKGAFIVEKNNSMKILFARNLSILETSQVIVHEYIHYYIHIHNLFYKNEDVEEIVVNIITYFILLKNGIDTQNEILYCLVQYAKTDANLISDYREIIIVLAIRIINQLEI
ncbi:hypothetical protein [Alkaliphilus sp. B6464]|uniref:hypothetical protein n=1 Tax=Alkaliphilus sp. B6464 TaxID=2731219 RepID=UPI001BABF9EC|nr:hypothetical protein [Alkaliphilus sp. B6464]QUH21923.1 hypothetical protein HYG84_18480 [Alkaliphilus sp. B6464]